MAISNSYNFRQLSESVTTSGVVGGNRLKGLAAEGYTMLVNLLPDDNEHAVPDEQQIVESQGLEYVYIPVDFLNPTEEEYRQFCAVLDRAGSAKMHIHCAANFRVSAFYGRYACERGLLSPAQAEALIRALWNPDRFSCWQIFLADVISSS